MTSKQLRHWLNDLADKGGMPRDALTRWMGRTHTRDTEAYLHATLDERVAWVKEGIKTGEMVGAAADAYFAQPADEREDFLDGQVQATHVTAMGLCIHDFAVNPCAYHLNCMRGCPDYVRRKGNEVERSVPRTDPRSDPERSRGELAPKATLHSRHHGFAITRRRCAALRPHWPSMTGPELRFGHSRVVLYSGSGPVPRRSQREAVLQRVRDYIATAETAAPAAMRSPRRR